MLFFKFPAATQDLSIQEFTAPTWLKKIRTRDMSTFLAGSLRLSACIKEEQAAFYYWSGSCHYTGQQRKENRRDWRIFRKFQPYLRCFWNFCAAILNTWIFSGNYKYSSAKFNFSHRIIWYQIHRIHNVC